MTLHAPRSTLHSDAPNAPEPSDGQTCRETLTSQPSPLNSLINFRVCLLAGTLGQGGAERQLFYIASALKQAGAKVLVLSLRQGEFWEAPLQALKIQVKCVGASGSRLVRLFRITRAVEAYSPDIVQSQHFYTNGYAALAARCCGLRSVGAVRGSGTADVQDCGPRFAQACLRWPHLLAVNSRAALRTLVSMGCPEQKLHYLPNVIDLERFRPAESNPDRPLTILTVGRLGPEKRFDRFLRALAWLRRSQPTPFRALIAGNGPLRAELERRARAAGLYPGLVQFCGAVSDVQALYQRAHLFVLTSDHEGTPNVVMEAMASGLPVVATAVGGLPDLVQPGATGFLVAPAREQDLADAIGKLLHDAALRRAMSRCARASVAARHSLGSLPAQLKALYGRVLPPARPVVASLEASAV